MPALVALSSSANSYLSETLDEANTVLSSVIGTGYSGSNGLFSKTWRTLITTGVKSIQIGAVERLHSSDLCVDAQRYGAMCQRYERHCRFHMQVSHLGTRATTAVILLMANMNLKRIVRALRAGSIVLLKTGIKIRYSQ